MLVSPEISMLILFPKLKSSCLLRWSIVPLPSYRQNWLHPVSQIEKSHFPFHLNCPVPIVSPEESVLSRPTCLEFSAFASMVKTSYYCRESVVRKSVRSSVAFPSFGRRGWIAPPLNQPASKIETMQYAVQIVENNQAIVPNMKKSTLIQQ